MEGHPTHPRVTSAEPHDARAGAIAAASAIFYRPERIVDALVASFITLPEGEFPGIDAVAQICYREPIRMSATREVFALRPLHWPMLNLIDLAEHQRRAFAQTVAHAVAAARARPE